MKKKYQKPKLKRVNPMDNITKGIPDLGVWNGSPPAGPGHNGPGVNQKPFQFKFSQEIQPEIKYDPLKLPESVSIDHPKCPNCGTPAKAMIAYGVIGGESLSKNHCVVCGHNWGHGE